jgi:hypothetical protein
MSSFTTPPATPYTRLPPTVITVTKPIMGGKVEYDYKETAWTGGKPNYDWTGLANSKATKMSPDCWRQANPIYESKAFRKLTEPLADEKKFELEAAEPTLSAFAKRVKIHDNDFTKATLPGMEAPRGIDNDATRPGLGATEGSQCT